MPFKTPITIKEATDNIHSNRYLLPAIQREFVWQPHQIERLFDSLMRGYPIGSFLFWRVDPETAKNYNFFQFITNYDRRKPHNPIHPAPSTVPGLKAVLDGQQRLTALNVGLYGSGKWKLPRLWWNNPHAFPKRRLHLNLLASRKEDEEELSYKFRLLRVHENGEPRRRNDPEHWWYPVGDILDVEHPSDLIDTSISSPLGRRTKRSSPTSSAYCAFMRMGSQDAGTTPNTGGTPWETSSTLSIRRT